jgi:rod shape-determining protein MreB
MTIVDWFKNRLFCDLAIDLGTANTLVFLKGRGIIVQEPSIVVVNKISGKVEAVGGRAKDMLGKTPTSVTAIKPMRDGVIADFEIAEKMLDYFIKKATNNRGFWLRPRIVIIPPASPGRTPGCQTGPCGQHPVYGGDDLP